MLSGPLILDGIILGYASRTLPVTAAWRDESTYVRTRGGTLKRKGKGRFRLLGKFGFEAVDATDLAQLKALTSVFFPVVLRSRAGGDPSFPEVEVLVRRTNDIEDTGPLFRRSEGAHVYRIEIEVESVQTAERPLGAITGGYTVVATDETELLDGVEIPVLEYGAWGEATITETTVEIPLGDGQTGEVPVFTFGPPELAQFLIHDVPGDPFAISIDTTGTLRFGTGTRQFGAAVYTSSKEPGSGSESA